MEKNVHPKSYRWENDFLLKFKLPAFLLLIFLLRINVDVFSQNTVAQQAIKISGKITDSTGSPLPGTNVVIEGATKGVIANSDGNYVILAIPDAKLHFSFIGMVEQIIPINGRNTIDVILQETLQTLQDVVVVGFGKQKKQNVLSAIETVNVDQLRVPSSNLTTAFAGRMAGVISYQTTGEPGKDQAQFFIRGITSFGAAAKKDPLILIDNVELTATDLGRLNADDIQSFSILKDATATALYGARGANGVILVMTKQGKEGPLKFNVRVEDNVSQSTRDFETSDAITFMKLNNEAVRTRNPAGALPYSAQKIAETINGTNPYVYPTVNWKDMLTKKYANNQRVNFNLTGGGSKVQYYLSGAFSQDNGILKLDKKNNFNSNIDLKKYLIRSNVNINLTKTTTMVVRMQGTFDDYSGPMTDGATVYTNAIKANPVLFPAYYAPDEANKFTNHILFGNAGVTTNEYLESVFSL